MELKKKSLETWSRALCLLLDFRTQKLIHFLTTHVLDCVIAAILDLSDMLRHVPLLIYVKIMSRLKLDSKKNG